MPRRKEPYPIRDIFLAGQLFGLACQINHEALQKYLDSPACTDFNYKQLCRSVIAFCRALDNTGDRTNALREP